MAPWLLFKMTLNTPGPGSHEGLFPKNVAENLEGRERFPINVRYERDFRDNLDELGRVLVATPSGAQIPLGRLRGSHIRVAQL